MATITMDELLAAMEDHEISRNDPGVYLEDTGDDSVGMGEILMSVRFGDEHTNTRACAVGEAALQLARMARCDGLGAISGGFDITQTLVKCVEGTDAHFWNTVDELHSHSVYCGLTRAQHIRKAWDLDRKGDLDSLGDYYNGLLVGE